MNISDAWISVHIYYFNDHDLLLSDCLFPLVTRLQRTGSVTRSFFLRHWLGGPHVRVRLQSSPVRAREAVKTEVINSIIDFLERHPSNACIDSESYQRDTRLFSQLEGIDASSHAIKGNNTITLEPYVPEYQKYGGRKGIDIAEEVFTVSSGCALEFLSHGPHSVGMKLVYGLTSLLIGMKAFGLTSSEMGNFLVAYQGAWRALQGDVPALVLGLGASPERLERWATSILNGRWPKAAYYTAWWTALARSSARLVHEYQPSYLSCDVVIGRKPATSRWMLMQFLHTHYNRVGLNLSHESLVVHFALGLLGVADFVDASHYPVEEENKRAK